MDLLTRDERRSFYARLTQMPNPVHLLIFTRRADSRGSAARQLGLELRSLSRNVHLELPDVDANPLLAARYGIGETPAMALLTGGVVIADTHIRFSGLPEGPVLTALVDGIVAVSHSPARVPMAADWRRLPLDRPVHLDIYVPRPAAADSQALLWLQRLVLRSTQLSLDVMIGVDSPEWARRSESAGTTLIVVNDTIVLRDSGSEEQLLDALEATTWGEPERLDREAPDRAVLVGVRPTAAPTAAAAALAVLTQH
ncbi:MAG: hypothetical protein ACR2JY_15550 [Chloroflexota bacterium]